MITNRIETKENVPNSAVVDGMNADQTMYELTASILEYGTMEKDFRGKVVLFDFDDTLMFNKPTYIDVIHQKASEQGVPLDERKCMSAHRRLLQYWSGSTELLEDRLLWGGVENDCFWTRQISRHLRLLDVAGSDADALAVVIYKQMAEDFQRLDYSHPDVIPALNELSDSGFKLGIVSNREEGFDDVLKDLGFTGLFDVVVCAGAVNKRKPDPEILLHTAQLLGVAQSEIAYVGDNPFMDVICSLRAGIFPFLLDKDNLFPGLPVATIRTVGELPALLCGEKNR